MTRRLLALLALAACCAAPVHAKDEAPASADKSAGAPKKKKRELKDIQQIISAARKDGKLAFIQMGREACGNCQALKKSIDSGAFDLPEKSFVRGEVNCDDPKVNAEFDRRFKVKGDMLPFVAITDGKGKLLASSSGGVSKAKFDEMVAKALAASGKTAEKTAASPAGK